jgi:hypothetical protein
LLKPHGSLGWFRIEEGEADVGWSDALRENPRVATFRYPLADLISNEPPAKLSGESGFTCRSGRTLTGKIGAVWFRPEMAFAQARKPSLLGVSGRALQRLSHLLSRAARLVVIGYGWRDSHINDLVLSNMARGLEVVTIGSRTPPGGLLELIVAKFPTTHRRILTQLHTAGGGAQRVLDSGEGLAPDGSAHGLPVDALFGPWPLTEAFSLAKYAESNRWSLGRARHSMNPSAGRR